MGADERREVPDHPEVRELLGVHHRSDAADLAAGDLERPHADQPLLAVKDHHSRTTVYLGRPQREIGKPRDDPHPGEQHAGDAVAAAQRSGQRRDLPAAVAGQHHVVCQQGLEPGQIPLLGGGEKPQGELLALLPRGLEPGAALLDVTPGPARQLTHVVLALADDLSISA